MNYSCEGEYNEAINAQGQAEAEYQAHASYEHFLNDLIENGNMYEYYLHHISDRLESSEFKNSGKSPSEYLRLLAAENLNPIQGKSDSGERPF